MRASTDHEASCVVRRGRQKHPPKGHCEFALGRQLPSVQSTTQVLQEVAGSIEWVETNPSTNFEQLASCGWRDSKTAGPNDPHSIIHYPHISVALCREGCMGQAFQRRSATAADTPMAKATPMSSQCLTLDQNVRACESWNGQGCFGIGRFQKFAASV